EHRTRGMISEEIGVCYKIMNELVSAREWYQKALDVFTEENDVQGVGNVQRDFGLSYLYEEDYETALNWLTQSKQTLNQLPPSASLGITITKIGAVKRAQHNFEEAEQYILQGLEIIRGAQDLDSFMEMTTLLELGAVYFYTADYQEGIDRLREALAVLIENDQLDQQVRRVGEIYVSLTWCYLKQGRIEQSVSSFIKAMKAWESMDAETTQLVIEKSKVEDLIDSIETADAALGDVVRAAYEDIL
ncbi:MAG: tetratricopeptide repeat protein, partial [Bacteroidetes bacterium]|nr:tetratricopeptide repeat protein [Bacteroidota bacterium]